MSTEALAVDVAATVEGMASRGYALAVADGQMWEARFYREGEERWPIVAFSEERPEFLVYKSCDQATAIRGAAWLREPAEYSEP